VSEWYVRMLLCVTDTDAPLLYLLMLMKFAVDVIITDTTLMCSYRLIAVYLTGE